MEPEMYPIQSYILPIIREFCVTVMVLLPDVDTFISCECFELCLCHCVTFTVAVQCCPVGCTVLPSASQHRSPQTSWLR